MKNKNNTNQAGESAVTRERNVSFGVMKYFIAALLLTVLIFFGFTSKVQEGNCAIILRFGEVRRETTEAGLYFRLPWPFESVVTYDNRVQYIESNYLETVTKDKRNVILQSYVIWVISDPVLYHNRVGSQGKVDSYIKDQVFSATNSVMGSYDLAGLVSLNTEEIKTGEIQRQIFERVRENCERTYGISVMDVSIIRVSLPDTNLASVFEQMKADRQKDIQKIISEAERDANAIIVEADEEAARIIADGTTAAAAINAKTETDVAKIYAEAQAANIELYQFLKQLDTVIASVGESTVLVVKADEYPFRVLTEYGDYLSEGDGDALILKDLSYILSRLPEADRQALIDAVYQLISAAGGGSQ